MLLYCSSNDPGVSNKKKKQCLRITACQNHAFRFVDKFTLSSLFRFNVSEETKDPGMRRYDSNMGKCLDHSRVPFENSNGKEKFVETILHARNLSSSSF